MSKTRAAIPFSKANEYIRVNPFGSNVILRWGGNYFEIDVLGRNVPLPGAEKNAQAKSQVYPEETLVDDSDLIFHNLADADIRPEKLPAAQTEQLRRHRAKLKRRELRLLINQNFDPASAQLVTATFNDSAIEYNAAAAHFRLFRHELQRKVKDVRYLSVIEPGKQRGYHLHMVTDRKLPLTLFEAKEYIDKGVIKTRAGALTALWPHGDIHQKDLDGGGNLGACLGRYLSKKAHSPEMNCKHSINKSSNLTPYTTMRGTDALEFIQQFVIRDSLTEFYSYTCTDLEHIDYLHHYEFSLNPDKMLLSSKSEEQTTMLLA